MHSPEDELLLVAEGAALYGVSVRTVERWVEQGLPAQKATNEQLLALLAQKRFCGLATQRRLADPARESQPG